MGYALLSLAGLVIGGVIAWLLATDHVTKSFAVRIQESERRANLAEGRASGLEGTIDELRSQSQVASEDFGKIREQLATESSAKVKAETQLAETIQRLDEEKKLLEEAKIKLTDTFKALASDTLNNSTTAFLKLAKETLDKVLSDARGDLGTRQEAIRGMVKPLADSIMKFEEHVRGLEKTRQEAYTSLEGHITTLITAQQQLQRETSSLVTALRTPQVRGRWGELTLKRVVELAGMSDHCDFTEQVSVDSEAGRLRPDLIVSLPGGREIVVDAKVALDAFLDAAAASTEEQRNDALTRHSTQVRTHMTKLSAKSYWDQFPKAPEFVVMFIPGESFFAAAADADHHLIEDALNKRVVLATPTTLIALIRSVAYGWRQEQIAKNAQEISELGKQLYERMRTMAEHLGDVGNGLEKANTAYNKAIGSLEARILPAARRFKELGAATGNEIPTLSQVETTPRELATPEANGGRE